MRHTQPGLPRPSLMIGPTLAPQAHTPKPKLDADPNPKTFAHALPRQDALLFDFLLHQLHPHLCFRRHEPVHRGHLGAFVRWVW